MKKLFTLTAALAFLLFSFTLNAQRNCGTMEHLEQQIQQNPDIRQNLERIERFTQDYIKNRINGRAVTGVVTIPVVVHVVYNNANENISDAQVQSQIDVLNEDFRRTNADAADTPSDFSGVAADVEIEFCLASVDPNGASTNGITRTFTSRTSFGSNNDVKFDANGGKDAWPTGDYLNMWVCDLGTSLLGYAQFPGGPTATDGVVCNYPAFGRGGQFNLFTNFALGRTITHEVGHWLNLRHIWGDGGCSVDDFVNDTPLAGGPNYTGTPCTYPGPNSCRPKGKPGQVDDFDMFQNYMDYSDDACMNLFTLGQTDRMRALFDAGGARESFMGSNGCGGGTGGPVCGNGTCETGEDCASCPGDCGTCPPATCDAPSGLNSNGIKGGKDRQLSWTAVTGAVDYTVEIRPSGGTWTSSTVVSSPVKASDLLGGDPNNGTTYEWRVTTNCNGESSAPTGIESFVGGSRNRESGRLISAEGLTVYPNPASNLLTVEFSMDNLESGRARILLNDVLGRVVSTVEVTDIMNYVEMDVSKLTNAVYFLRLVDGKGEIKATKKVLINR